MKSVSHAGSLKGNWPEFWRQVQRDHAHAGLIWNERTRAELRDALQVRHADLCSYSRKRSVLTGMNYQHDYPQAAREHQKPADTTAAFHLP